MQITFNKCHIRLIAKNTKKNVIATNIGPYIIVVLQIDLTYDNVNIRFSFKLNNIDYDLLLH